MLNCIEPTSSSPLLLPLTVTIVLSFTRRYGVGFELSLSSISSFTITLYLPAIGSLSSYYDKFLYMPLVR